MDEIINNARSKAAEAGFFLSLMDHIEVTRDPLIRGVAAEDAFTYALSAFLNACYSASAVMEHDKSSNEAGKAFRKANGEFYARGPDGGHRTKAVHYRPVRPALDGHRPQSGRNVLIRFGRDQQSTSFHKGADLVFGSAFYFSDASPQHSICDMCALHVLELKKLIDGLRS